MIKKTIKKPVSKVNTKPVKKAEVVEEEDDIIEEEEVKRPVKKTIKKPIPKVKVVEEDEEDEDEIEMNDEFNDDDSDDSYDPDDDNEMNDDETDSDSDDDEEDEEPVKKKTTKKASSFKKPSKSSKKIVEEPDDDETDSEDEEDEEDEEPVKKKTTKKASSPKKKSSKKVVEELEDDEEDDTEEDDDVVRPWCKGTSRHSYDVVFEYAVKQLARRTGQDKETIKEILQEYNEVVLDMMTRKRMPAPFLEGRVQAKFVPGKVFPAVPGTNISNDTYKKPFMSITFSTEWTPETGICNKEGGKSPLSFSGVYNESKDSFKFNESGKTIKVSAENKKIENQFD